MQAIFDHSKPEADHIRTFYFKPTRPVRYVAGQFTELVLPHEKPDSRGIKRWFTLSSSPTEELLSITTKFTHGAGSSFKRTLLNLDEGDKVNLAEPMGDFVLPKDKNRPLVFIAAGMGITPMRSMIKWLNDSEEHRTIHLIYAVTSPEEFAFRELFKQYGLPVTLMVSNPPPGWQSETGHLTTKKILELEPDVDNKLYFMSGPEPMIEDFFKEFKDRGINESRLVTDYFPGYEVIK